MVSGECGDSGFEFEFVCFEFSFVMLVYDILEFIVLVDNLVNFCFFFGLGFRK